MQKYKSINNITISLVSYKKGEEFVPFRSGLNWGQRPNRSTNQAYLRIPASIQKSGFFPDIGNVFKVICDDGFELNLVRAQQNGKALHSKPSNSILGSYFRKRLGLDDGDLVTLTHLLKYGRTTVDFHKRDNSPYYLDFHN